EAIHLLLQEDIVDHAVEVLPGSRQLVSNLALTDRTAYADLGGRAAAIAHPDTRHAGEGLRGQLCLDVDRTADRIATIDRALRTFENLDALDVIQVLVELVGMDLLDTVNDRGDRRLTIAHLGESANRQCTRARILRFGNADVGRQLDEVGWFLDAGIDDLLLAECGHGNRHILQRFHTL